MAVPGERGLSVKVVPDTWIAQRYVVDTLDLLHFILLIEVAHLASQVWGGRTNSERVHLLSFNLPLLVILGRRRGARNSSEFGGVVVMLVVHNLIHGFQAAEDLHWAGILGKLDMATVI